MGCFWEEFAGKCMEGSSEKVPVFTPLRNVNCFQVGRFVSHSYMLTGFFPICFSCMFAMTLTCGEECVTDNELVTSFFNFIDSFEAQPQQQQQLPPPQPQQQQQ